jgi:hypothetical protein
LDVIGFPFFLSFSFKIEYSNLILGNDIGTQGATLIFQAFEHNHTLHSISLENNNIEQPAVDVLQNSLKGNSLYKKSILEETLSKFPMLLLRFYSKIRQLMIRIVLKSKVFFKSPPKIDP